MLRDGQQQLVATAELVPGDILTLEEGDTLPADARVLQAIALRVAESALTGESTAVAKDPAAVTEEAGIADRANMVFSGTAVASGRGRAIVVATGCATELGRIAGSLQATPDVETPLQRELDRHHTLGRPDQDAKRSPPRGSPDVPSRGASQRRCARRLAPASRAARTSPP